MCNIKEMKRESLFTTWDSHKEVIRFKIQAKGNTFPKQGIVKLCNLLSAVDAKYLNGFKRDYTNACRILLLVAIKKSNKSFDASRCFRSPSLMTARNWVDDTGWHFLQLCVSSLKCHEGRTLEHVVFWVCPGRQLLQRSCGDKKSARLLCKRNLQG